MTSPKPMLSRGVYFDGNDYMTVNNLKLNTKFSLEFWIRVQGNGQLLLVGNSYLIFGITTFKPELLFDGDFFITNEQLDN